MPQVLRNSGTSVLLANMVGQASQNTDLTRNHCMTKSQEQLAEWVATELRGLSFSQ